MQRPSPNPHYRARMMDSSIGRFSGKDNLPSINKYIYVEDQPTRFTDYSGNGIFDKWNEVAVKIGEGVGKVGGALADFGETLSEGLRIEGESFGDCMSRNGAGYFDDVGSAMVTTTGAAATGASAQAAIVSTSATAATVTGLVTAAAALSFAVGWGAGSAWNCR